MRGFMIQTLQTAKRLILILVTTILLFTGILVVQPVQAKADICIGEVKGCGSQTGDRGLVIKPEAKLPKETDLIRANLQGKNLTEANLNGANLSQAKLSGANLSGADFSGATLTGINLKGANISDVDLSGVKLSKQSLIALIKVNLTGGGWFQSSPILSKQDLLDLLEPELDQVILSGDNLKEANLSGANLSKANFIGANLQGAKLSGADLTGADLTGAKLPNGKIYKP